jgi:hypothetical protein
MSDLPSSGLIAEGTSYFKRWNGTTYASGFEKLEGTTELGIEVSVDEKLQESRDKYRTGTIPENGTVRILKPTKVSITLNRWNKQSAAMALMGIDTALTVGSSTQTAEAVTLAGAGLYVPSGVRNVEAGSVVVTNTGATVTYVEGVDYDFVYTTGDIAKLTTGAIADGASVKVTAQQNAIAGWQVDVARVPQIKGYFKFDGRNLADNRNLIVYSPMLVLASNTSLDLMKNDYNEFKMKGMPELKVGEQSALWFEYF